MEELSGGFGGLLVQVQDWATREQQFRSYELLARYVMPRYKNAFVGVQAAYQHAAEHRSETEQAVKRNTKLNLTLQVHQPQENLVGPMRNPVDRPGCRNLGNGLGSEGQPLWSQPEDQHTDLFPVRLGFVLILPTSFVTSIFPRLCQPARPAVSFV